jgi:hypothetical protein
MKRRRLTTLKLLYPFLSFLQAECSFATAVIVILIDVKDFLVGAG